MYGGKMKSRKSKHREIQAVPPRRWTLKISYLYSTLRGLRVSRKVSCIQLPVIWCSPAILLQILFNINQEKSISVRPTSVRFQATVILFTDLCHQVLLHSCLNVSGPIRTPVDIGISSTNIKSTLFTRHLLLSVLLWLLVMSLSKTKIYHLYGYWGL